MKLKRTEWRDDDGNLFWQEHAADGTLIVEGVRAASGWYEEQRLCVAISAKAIDEVLYGS